MVTRFFLLGYEISEVFALV